MIRREKKDEDEEEEWSRVLILVLNNVYVLNHQLPPSVTIIFMDIVHNIAIMPAVAPMLTRIAPVCAVISKVCVLSFQVNVLRTLFLVVELFSVENSFMRVH